MVAEFMSIPVRAFSPAAQLLFSLPWTRAPLAGLRRKRRRRTGATTALIVTSSSVSYNFPPGLSSGSWANRSVRAIPPLSAIRHSPPFLTPLAQAGYIETLPLTLRLRLTI